MIQTIRLGLAIALTTLLAAATCMADTWTDASGKFSVEANFVGVEGRAIVLRKSDGSTIKVPIDKLSADSRAKAKQLYEASRTGAAPAAATSASSPNMTAEATGDAGAFPANASLQQTVDHVKNQIIAGHPEVLWLAMPTSMRQKMDSAEVRTALKPMLQQNAQSSKPVEDITKKVFQILKKQKQFILNADMIKTQIPPPMMPMVQQAYDPTVGLLNETVTMAFDFKKVGNQTFTEFFGFYGPRIGSHMKSLMPMLPPGAIDQMSAEIEVVETTANSGTVTIPGQEGPTVIEMVRYEDRWIPKDVADGWDGVKDSLVQEIQKMSAEAEQQSAQANMMVAMMAGTVNQLMDPLMTASSQEEFDAAIMQVMSMASMLGGGAGGPGGPGGAPGGGFPGGGFPGGGGF
ncbi:MAG: SHD1 domain-containing protein [Planctomycetota bacterium]